MTHKDNCIFCQIVAAKAPAHIVWESETHLAFLSIFPNTEGVTVVIPKHHYGSYIFDQDNEVIAAQMIASKEVAKKLDAAFEDVGRTGVIFEGFGVDHLHTKLYPLHGTKMDEWKNIESTNNNQYFEIYPGYMSSNDSERADDATLAQLAQKIRASAK